jgi:hypothetical protein
MTSISSTIPAEFENGFGSKCDVIAETLAASFFPMTLWGGSGDSPIEWMTLQHYIEGVQDNQGLDPQFKSLLKNHWLEESQHTKLDTLMVGEIAGNATAQEIDEAFKEYGEIGAFLDQGIQQQTEFDVENFLQATGRELSKGEREATKQAVLKGMRWTYLGTGMTHPNFLETVESIKPEARQQIEQMAPMFC